MTPSPTLWRLFWVFLVMGATSIGGGVVGYLRAGLVARERWLDDQGFVELLSISQTLPGLNATNMAILVGDRLRGAPRCGAGGARDVPAGRVDDDGGRPSSTAPAATAHWRRPSCTALPPARSAL